MNVLLVLMAKQINPFRSIHCLVWFCPLTTVAGRFNVGPVYQHTFTFPTTYIKCCIPGMYCKTWISLESIHFTLPAAPWHMGRKAPIVEIHSTWTKTHHGEENRKHGLTSGIVPPWWQSLSSCSAHEKITSQPPTAVRLAMSQKRCLCDSLSAVWVWSGRLLKRHCKTYTVLTHYFYMMAFFYSFCPEYLFSVWLFNSWDTFVL